MSRILKLKLKNWLANSWFIQLAAIILLGITLGAALMYVLGMMLTLNT